MDFIFNAVGLAGMATVLIAYFLLQHGTLRETSIYYLSMNFFGSLALMISLLKFWNLASFLLNGIWMAISIYGFIKSRRIA